MRIYWTALFLATALVFTGGGGCKIVEEDASAQHVDIDALPLKVSAAVKGQIPNGTITHAQMEQRGRRSVYRFDVKDGLRTYDMIVAPDGQVLSTNERR